MHCRFFAHHRVDGKGGYTSELEMRGTTVDDPGDWRSVRDARHLVSSQCVASGNQTFIERARGNAMAMGKAFNMGTRKGVTED
jgi:hypothetical protein